MLPAEPPVPLSIPIASRACSTARATTALVPPACCTRRAAAIPAAVAAAAAAVAATAAPARLATFFTVRFRFAALAAFFVALDAAGRAVRLPALRFAAAFRAGAFRAADLRLLLRAPFFDVRLADFDDFDDLEDFDDFDLEDFDDFEEDFDDFLVAVFFLLPDDRELFFDAAIRCLLFKSRHLAGRCVNTEIDCVAIALHHSI